MERFVKRHSHSITGTIAGFDRLLFRGTLRSISYLEGLQIFLSIQGVLYKDFGQFAEKLSPQIKAQAESMAKRQNRPYQYIESSVVSKEDLAKQIMEQDQITEGLVCVLSCVEPCQSFPSAGTEKLERCLWFRKGESVFTFTFITLIESLG